MIERMSFPVFPASGSIPPPCFYNRQGLAAWLNQNPSYKTYFTAYPNVFPYLKPSNAPNLPVGYQIENVPLSPNVTTLSQRDAVRYDEYFNLFRKVYTYNMNAYLDSLTSGVAPVYYRFRTYEERSCHTAAVGVVNKLYPLQAIVGAKDENGVALGWVIPFPF